MTASVIAGTVSTPIALAIFRTPQLERPPSPADVVRRGLRYLRATRSARRQLGRPPDVQQHGADRAVEAGKIERLAAGSLGALRGNGRTRRGATDHAGD